MPVTFAPHDFMWATGIEDTFVPQHRPHQRPLDEYELMGHYGHWHEDLALIRDLGAQAVRWGVPWHRVEPEDGQFDWSWTDQVVPYMVDELGILPIIDLMHYGCPEWLSGSFNDGRYPDSVARYAAAFARRYRHLVHWYTPLNEPHMTALMCGQRGLWPPYLRGERGYLRVMTQVVRGMIKTIRAIRDIDPQAVIVQVEATALHRAAHDELQSFAEEERERRFLSYDLLDGRVTAGHPSFNWLVRNGVQLSILREIADHPTPIDVMGLNFYPQWSTHQLYVARNGHMRIRSCEQDGLGFVELIQGHYGRFGVPVMVTETSAYGSVETRSRWLETSVNAIKTLREDGVPVVGYTWFPLFTMVDWRYRFGKGTPEEYHIDLGLFTRGTGDQRWQSTPLAEQFARYTKDSLRMVGSLPLGDSMAVATMECTHERRKPVPIL